MLRLIGIKRWSMLRLAIKMMAGDRAKFLGIILGLTFATFIITQQAGIFVGLMTRTYGFITDTRQPDIWVMDPDVQYIDDLKSIKFSRLFQVRSIEGVEWAVPMYKGTLKARLQSGLFQNCNIIGIDDATLIGGPPRITVGDITDLRQPDAVIVNEVGAKEKLATKINGKLQPIRLGEVFEINDMRAKVVGFCRLGRTFLSQPVIYTTFQNALQYAPSERNLLTFILVKAMEGMDPKVVCDRIRNQTKLAAYTSEGFKKLTIRYYLLYTGIPINFGIAVILGIIIGIAISGQTFYNFAHDNRHYFATLKAMGITNQLLAKMIIVQAIMTAWLSWGIGVGITTLFGFSGAGTELSFKLPWWLFLGSGVAMTIITLLSALFGLYKIVRVEPGIVFQS